MQNTFKHIFLVKYICILVDLLPLLIFLLSAEWSSWLPLYGNLCCKLVAQPVCMIHNMMTGYLNQKVP